MHAFPSSTNSTGVWYISWISLWSTWFLTQQSSLHFVLLTNQSPAFVHCYLKGQQSDLSRQDDLCVPDEAGAAAHNPLDAPEPQHLRAHHPRQVLHHAPAHRPRHLAQADVALVTQSHLFILQSSFFSHRNENIFIFRVCFVSDSQTLDSVVNLINSKIMPPSILILKTVCLVITTRLIDVGDGSLLVWAVPLPEDGG